MSKLSGKKLIDTIKNKGKNLEAEMSFFDHLEVLRWHLIRSAIAIAVFMVLAFSFYDFIFDDIIMGPKSPDFWTYRVMCKIAEWLNTPDFCVTEVPGTIINTQMAGQFILQINSSLIIAVLLGFPYLLYEVWLFVKPALTDVERKSSSGFVFYASILFILGVLFGYFVVVPLAMNFLANYSISDSISNTITIDNYLSFVATLTLGCGIVFELPIVIFILSKLGIMTPQFMRKSRQYAVVVILIIAAIITPTPDIITMLTVSFPMFLLYELSIVVAARVYKNKMKAEVDFYRGEDQ
ncbi:Sec-independent protein translocase protein TatC [Parapedobacter defluvii]|uniref:Sec-independent protein translocase protein TatC n=1 Tax=Parapedobacter defluvii TaxID=2045106 RepID=A0ABQ1LID3_9SPHI|nr:twin-arginine translocase subunit TatC [Parapedobacter defluvii]RQP19402.1 MAG: twin-arginine translocase subunit TatC [Parapedobacter sp.]GGC24581.1 Sec-independent protein translocase protein TatC [Parapedobacter defluvii]